MKFSLQPAQRSAPRPTQIRQVRVGVRVEGRNNAGSSRTPLHHARRTRTIWQYWPRPGFVRAAPILSGITRTGLPSATPNRYDGQAVQVFHLHSNNTASRRNQLTLTRRAADVHYGHADTTQTRRIDTLTAARAQHPTRFTTPAVIPKILALPDTAWINQPQDDHETSAA